MPHMHMHIITNNPSVQLLENIRVSFYEESLLQILYRVRDFVHLHHRLITHPLAGSIKPNATPYKSIIISGSPQQEIDMQSLQLIEGAIQVSERMLRDNPPKPLNTKVQADYALIDMELMKSAISIDN